MGKYRKRPVVIEAEQFLEDAPLPFRNLGPVVGYSGEYYYVTTIHGQTAKIEFGDWVILEDFGFLAYPCKPDIFAKIYEKV